MSCIKDISAEINNWKINIPEAVNIHAFNNLDLHFCRYLAILSHDAWEKEKSQTPGKPTKILKDEQIHLSNEKRGKANYTYSSKPKKKKLSKQVKRVGMILPVFLPANSLVRRANQPTHKPARLIHWMLRQMN